ncbi:hypothetical protein MCEMSEM23_01563 [Rhabdaerophilaceae bacterium]
MMFLIDTSAEWLPSDCLPRVVKRDRLADPLAPSPAGGGPESEDDRYPTVPRLAAGFVIVGLVVVTRVIEKDLEKGPAENPT